MAWILQVRIANKFLNKYLHVSPQALKQAFKWLFPSQIEMITLEGLDKDPLLLKETMKRNRKEIGCSWRDLNPQPLEEETWALPLGNHHWLPRLSNKLHNLTSKKITTWKNQQIQFQKKNFRGIQKFPQSFVFSEKFRFKIYFRRIWVFGENREADILFFKVSESSSSWSWKFCFYMAANFSLA